MDITLILADIDTEIAHLQHIRSLLSGSTPTATRGRGRPKGSVNASPKKAANSRLSPEARARIAAAQKKRWAKQKKAAK